jgi:hypothetical protein
MENCQKKTGLVGKICPITKTKIKPFAECKISIVNGIVYGINSISILLDKYLSDFNFEKNQSNKQFYLEFSSLFVSEVLINILVNLVCFSAEARGLPIVPIIMTSLLIVVIIAYAITAVYVLNKK